MILTDAMALLYRSHYAFSDAHRLRNAAGTCVCAGWLLAGRGWHVAAAALRCATLPDHSMA